MESISGVRRDEVMGKCAFDVFPFLKETGESKYLLEALEGRSVVAENRPYAVPETGRAGFFEGTTRRYATNVARSLAESPSSGILPNESMPRSWQMKHTSDSARMWKTLPWQSLSGTKIIEYRDGYPQPRDFSDGKLRKLSERPSTNGGLFSLKIQRQFMKSATGSARGWIVTVSRVIETIQSRARSSTASGTTQFYMTTPED